jgi:uncharacterized paraquat-inducible protein A
MAGGGYILICVTSGLGAALIAYSKGSSVWLWFLIGLVVPILGPIAALLYRSERGEPERQCPNCSKILKLYVQVCPRCGTELFLPDPAETRMPPR